VIIGYLSDYFVIEDPSPVETRDAYLFAMGLTLLSLINTLIHGMGYHTAFKVAILTRNLFTAVIYQKILTLSQTVIGRVTVGHIVNLASNDVHKFDLVCYFFTDIIMLRYITVNAFLSYGLDCPTPYNCCDLPLISRGTVVCIYSNWTDCYTNSIATCSG
jgi:ATP-binding cassette subfamily C (CFTR/MRP) protein 4